MRLRTLTFFASLLCASASALSQQTVVPLWPHGAPEPPQSTAPEADVTTSADPLISGHRTRRLTNVSVPTLSVYSPQGNNAGAAALVFPGGGYVRLAWDGEGTDTCDWLNSIGVTCLLVKYRVPEHGRYPDNLSDLEDAQQAMRIARSHAAQWRIDPDRIGVVGFSAGGNLAVLLSTHPDSAHVKTTPAAADVDDSISAKPDFAIVVYPAYLAVEPVEAALDPVYQPNHFTPPTFLLQAQDDAHYGRNAIVYYRALMDARIPSELHYFATGGHGFGIHPAGRPEENWTKLAAAWLESINMLHATDAAREPSTSKGKD